MHESVCMKPLLFVQQEIMIKEKKGNYSEPS